MSAWIAAALVSGVAAGALVHFPTAPLVALSIASWLAATYAILRSRAWIVLAGVVVGAVASGALLGVRAVEDADAPSLLIWSRSQPAGTVAHIAGTIRDDASMGGYGVGLTLDVVEVTSAAGVARVRGGVRLTIAGALAASHAREWTAGRRISCDVVLREPIDYRDPGVASDRERLARGGIVLLGTVKSAALVSRATRAGWIDEVAASVRRYARRAIDDAVGRWSGRSAGVVIAILIGDRSGLGPEDERRMQAAGTYHVIAISGGNIALLTVMVLGIVRWCGVRPRTSAAIAIVVVAFYGYLAGLAPSVSRATMAGVVFLAGRALDRRGPAINALGVAAAAAALVDPLSILDPGFILSFGATVAIVVVAGRLRVERLPRKEQARLRRWLWGIRSAALALCAATLCAEIALVPPSARIFGRLSAAGLVLNFVAIPLMSIVQAAGLIAAAVWTISTRAASAAGWTAHVATVLLLESARLVDVAPWLVRDVPPPAGWVIVAWYAAWIAATVARRPMVKRVALAAAAVLLTLLIAGRRPLRAVRVALPPQGWSRIVFLDVGQGDATLVWPAGADPILVDAGGVPGSSFDLGRRVDLPALWALGVTRLGALVLTHGDPDHVGGAPPLLPAFRPRAIWEGIAVPGHAPLEALHAIASRQGIGWRQLRRGQIFICGAATIRVLNPPAPDWERRRVRNDDSIVLDVRIGGVSVILPGDIGAAVEREAFATFAHAPLTVVKAPHHGSAGSSSTAIIDATVPAAVVFSAGQRNPFGHPAPVVLDRYAAAGARMFRTDRDGAIVMDTDGHNVRVWTWSGRGELISPTAAGGLHDPQGTPKTTKAPKTTKPSG